MPQSSSKLCAFLLLEPGKRSGKPCIRGLRITVYDVLSYLAAGMTDMEILADFPALTKEDIRTQAKSLDVLIKRIQEAIELCLDIEEPALTEFIGIQKVAVTV